MSARKKVEVWAVIDVDGSFLAGPSNSESDVQKEANRRWLAHTFKATRFVPHDPDEARVLRLVKAFFRPHNAKCDSDPVLEKLKAAVAKLGGK